MTTDIATLEDLTLGRLRVTAGRLGLPQDMWTHLGPKMEEERLVEYLNSLLDALERHGMTLSEYIEVVDMRHGVLDGRAIRLPVSPIGRGRGRVR